MFFRDENFPIQFRSKITFAFSGIGGLEYMITDELFIDARYSYGITNILDKDLTSVEAKNSNIQFGFGIKI